MGFSRDCGLPRVEPWEWRNPREQDGKEGRKRSSLQRSYLEIEGIVPIFWHSISQAAIAIHGH